MVKRMAIKCPKKTLNSYKVTPRISKTLVSMTVHCKINLENNPSKTISDDCTFVTTFWWRKIKKVKLHITLALRIKLRS